MAWGRRGGGRDGTGRIVPIYSRPRCFPRSAYAGLRLSPPPPDSGKRPPVVVSPDDDLPHLAVGGGVYTILLSGEDTAGRYCVIEMRVPPGAGPPPHRHDFEETFAVLEGEIEVTVRGETYAAAAGSLAHVPANAPHTFRNVADVPARLLCTCSPAGQEQFFLDVAVRVDGPDLRAPALSDDEEQAIRRRAAELAPKYQSEFLGP